MSDIVFDVMYSIAVILLIIVSVYVIVLERRNASLRRDIVKALALGAKFRKERMEAVAERDETRKLFDKMEARINLLETSSCIRVELGDVAYEFTVSQETIVAFDGPGLDRIMESNIRWAKTEIEKHCSANGLVPWTDFKVQQMPDFGPHLRYRVYVGAIQKMARPNSVDMWYGQRVIPSVDPNGDVIGCTPVHLYGP